MIAAGTQMRVRFSGHALNGKLVTVEEDAPAFPIARGMTARTIFVRHPSLPHLIGLNIAHLVPA